MAGCILGLDQHHIASHKAVWESHGGCGKDTGLVGALQNKASVGEGWGVHPCQLLSPCSALPSATLSFGDLQTSDHGSFAWPYPPWVPRRTLPAWCLRLSPDPGACDVKLNQTDILEVRGPGDPLVGDHGGQEGLQL